MRGICLTFVVVIALGLAEVPAFADGVTNKLTFQDDTFSPATLSVAPDQKIDLLIKNNSDLVIEFESYDLNREKIIPAHGEVTIHIGPLDPGDYSYFNDFKRTSMGKIIVQK